jgi:Protein of unknown function (DUF3309)
MALTMISTRSLPQSPSRHHFHRARVLTNHGQRVTGAPRGDRHDSSWRVASGLHGLRRRGVSAREVSQMSTILIVILVLVLLGVVPTWPHSRGWGYGPSGIVGLLLVVLIVLALLGRL